MSSSGEPPHNVSNSNGVQSPDPNNQLPTMDSPTMAASGGPNRSQKSGVVGTHYSRSTGSWIRD
ncbi:hypothetical protein ACJ72_01940 [Emergomyces africanus]|uniref:Uncharacterized protein n=1 Tax=Emergomyces africanus TaxID=1955775 RepID=A0A1B7P3V7_9EURO|nr:hypothetical protein ACJ72_01940 [Emergomyces africanus]